MMRLVVVPDLYILVRKAHLEGGEQMTAICYVLLERI